QLETGAHAELPRRAMLVERTALYVLERDIRIAGLGEPSIVEARDARVLERGQELALARHSFPQPLANPETARKLQRHGPVDQAVGALGEPDRAHTAAAELANEPVGTEMLAFVVGGLR